jgi:hypothetical protein
MIRSMVRSGALCLIAALVLAIPVAVADPPKATMFLTNTTASDVVVEFDSPSTKAWMRVNLGAGRDHIVYGVTGKFHLVGYAKVGAGTVALVPKNVDLSMYSPARVRIERTADGRYLIL